MCCPVGGPNAGSQTEVCKCWQVGNEGATPPLTLTPHFPLQENHGHDYEEIQDTSGAALHCVYTTASHPTNLFHHQRFSSNGSEPCDANENASSAHDRSSVNGTATHPPAAEQTAYSTLKMPAEP